MDWYLFTAVVNSLWNLFAILFLLYRFTSFFTYTYNFLVFCGRFWKGMIWTKNTISDYVQQSRGYQRIHTEEDPESQELLYDNNITEVDTQNTNDGTFLQSLQDIFKNSTFDKSSEIELQQTKRRMSPKRDHPSQLVTLIEDDNDMLQSFSYLHTSYAPQSNQSVFEYPESIPTQKPYNVKSSSMLLNSHFINQTIDSKMNRNPNRDQNSTNSDDFVSQVLTPKN